MQHKTNGLRIAGVLAVGAIGASIVSDLLTTWWTDHAMITAFVSGILLIVVGSAIINEYLAARARRQWKRVAALALVQMRDSARQFAVELGSLLQHHSIDSYHAKQLRQFIEDSKTNANAQALTEAGIALLASPGQRAQIVETIERNLAKSQDVAVTWAPVVISNGSYVDILDGFVDRLNQAWRISWALVDVNMYDDRDAPSDAAIADQLAEVTIAFMNFQRELTQMIRDILPWPEEFGPAPAAI